ncbi:MAG: hypothetical protein ACJ790_07670 [Myxococcaceae bacterium]
MKLQQLFLLSAIASLLISASASAACDIKYGPYGILAQAPGKVTLPPQIQGDDTSAPSDPIVRDLKLVWIDNGLKQGAGGCPDVDALQFYVDSYDTQTAPENLKLAAYIAPDEQGAIDKTDPDILFRFSPSLAYEHEVGVVLGNAVGHERDGAPFRSPDPYCFTIAVIDEAGNVSERSNAMCVNTMDPTAPYAVRIDGSKGCGCGEVDGLGGLALAVLGAPCCRRRHSRRSARS